MDNAVKWVREMMGELLGARRAVPWGLAAALVLLSGAVLIILMGIGIHWLLRGGLLPGALIISAVMACVGIVSQGLAQKQDAG